MTRFFVTTDVEATLLHLGSVLDKLGYSWKKSTPLEVVLEVLTNFRIKSLLYKIFNLKISFFT